MVHESIWIIGLLIILALAFDFMNGFHDAANSIATIVSTGVLRPNQAVAFAAFFNLFALLLFPLSVAATIGKGIIDPHIVDSHIIFGALVGAIFWNIITWLYGIPSSSSHALIGGLIGACIPKAGFSALVWSGIFKTMVFIFVSPLLGFFLGSIIMVIVAHLFKKKPLAATDQVFRNLQLVSSAIYSIGHGGNDSQKTIGIIWLILISGGYVSSSSTSPGYWVILACYFAIALGTLFGGWRIVRTMGGRLTKLKPVGGFCAETGGAITLFIASGFGIPVSTTHTITGAIIGVGSTQHISGVRWGLAQNILWAWIITIPAAATFSFVGYFISGLLF
jgi:PiT family inorganic phosphate transporter